MTWCKDNREKAAMYALRGYNTFSNELEEVENILEIYPESPYIKLLAIRYINKMERNVLTATIIRMPQMTQAHSCSLPEKYLQSMNADRRLSKQ